MSGIQTQQSLRREDSRVAGGAPYRPVGWLPIVSERGAIPPNRHWPQALLWLVLAALTCGVAAARAQTPTDPAVFGLPSAAQENVGGRTERSKEFSLPDGTSAQLLFTHPIHYQDASAQWQDVDLSFHDDGEGGQIMDRHPSLRVRAPGRSGAIEITDTAGNGIRFVTAHAMNVHGRHVEYDDAQQITWTYTTTPTGVKHQATVASSRGPHTYRFPYQPLGNQPSFIIDADGNAITGDLEVPRATVKDANGIQHLAGPWRVQGQVLAFDFDDTDIPTPYTIDPTLQSTADVNDWGATSWADTWADARGGTGSSTLVWETSASSMPIGDNYDDLAPHPYSVSRYFVAFDTSKLRSSDSITHVYLYMGVQLDQSATDFTVKIREYNWTNPNSEADYLADWQGCLSSGLVQYTYDWRSTDGVVAYATPPPLTTYAGDDLRTQADHINRIGKTKYCLLSDRDLNNTTPTDAEYIDAYSAGSGGDPYLIVVYDPATPTPTRTRTNTVPPTNTPTPTNTPIPGAGTATPTRTPTPLCQPDVICPSSPCTITQSTTVGSGCNLDWSGKSVTINSGAVLQDPDGGSSLSIEAASLTVNGTLKARGGNLSITTTNDFTTAGSGTIDVKDGGSVTINAGRDCTLNGTTITADAITVPKDGGSISITCESVVGSGALSANGAGNSSHWGDGGTITVNATADKVVLSGTIDANSAGSVGFGGSVSIDAATQLTIGKAITATGTSGGIGGDVVLTAGGPAVIDGADVVTASPGSGLEGDGGWILVQADSILAAGALNASGSTTSGGIGGDVDLFSATGAITILCTGNLSASGGGAYAEGGWITVDSGGNVDITDCNASGNDLGGEVEISGQGTVNISGSVDATSSGGSSWAGDIWVYAGGDLNTAPGTTLKAYSSGSGALDGTITLEGCNLNLAASIDSRYGSHSGGANSVTYHGRLIAVSTVSMDSDNGSQNQLICPCSAGGCGACEHEPVFLGSSNPAYTVSRQQLPTCD